MTKTFRSCFVVVSTAVVAVLAAGASTNAAAYCRKTTSGPSDPSYDPSAFGGSCGDNAGALPLYWQSGCVEYQVIVEQDLTDQGKVTGPRAHDLVREAARAWIEAPCKRPKGGDLSPSLRIVDIEQARCGDGPVGLAAKSNNQIRFKATGPETPGTLALTQTLHNGPTGRITEAVISIYNTADPGDGTPATAERYEAAIRNAVRHELGHFLGLAHSADPTAIMFAGDHTLGSAALTNDDLNAICIAYPPDAPVGGGCAVSTSPPGKEPVSPASPVVPALVLVPLAKSLARVWSRRPSSEERRRRRLLSCN